MTARILTLASAKGGSGKTTIAATFGTFLNKIGYRVLLIDCDEATNGLTLLYLNRVNDFPSKVNRERHLCHGVFDDFDEASLLTDRVQIGEGPLFLCPATFSFERRESFSYNRFYGRIRETITDSRFDFDFIILDAQAGSDQISLVTMSRQVSDIVIIVSEYDPLSAAGVERLKGIAGDDLAVERTWSLLNKMLPEFVEVFSDFLSISHYLPPVPWTADAVRAYSRRELALNFDVGNEYTLAIIQTIKSLPFADVRQRVEEWTDQMAASIRQPIVDQYSDLEMLLGSATDRVAQINMTIRRRSWFTFIIAAMFPAILAIILFMFQIRGSGNDDKITTSIIVGVALLTASTAIFSGARIEFVDKMFKWIKFGDTGKDSNIELLRLARQIDIYNSKLKELEFLKSANSSELINKSFGSTRKRRL